MIYFGWSEWDPVEGSAQSIDPLRSLAHAGKLSDLVFPGSSGRVWRLRYLSALCFLLKLAELEKGQPYRTNYLKFRKFENAFILATQLLRQRFGEQHNFTSLVGMNKATELIRTNGNRIDVTGDILANQMNLGPLGQHAVLLRSLELIEPTQRELLLFPKGEELADLFEQAIGDDAKIFKDAISSPKIKNLRLDSLELLSERMVFSFQSQQPSSERSKLAELIYREKNRKQLFTDVLSLKEMVSLNEAQLIDGLAELDSPLRREYQLIRAYDKFHRIIHYYFAVIRQVTIDEIVYSLEECARLQNAYRELKPYMLDQIEELLARIDDFITEVVGNDDQTVADIRELASGLKNSLSSHTELSTFLIQFHQDHQKSKGKAPWVKLGANGFIEVSPHNAHKDYLASLAEFTAINTHSYRFSNCRRMIIDLNLNKDAA